MFTLFKKAGPWRQAIKDGLILDMGKRPYRKINRIVGVPFPLAITPGAFEQLIALTDTPAHRQLVEAFRWGDLLVKLIGLFPSDEATESVFEINVVAPDGSLQTKMVKAVTGYTDDGREAMIFMLPEEMVSIPPTLEQELVEG